MDLAALGPLADKYGPAAIAAAKAVWESLTPQQKAALEGLAIRLGKAAVAAAGGGVHLALLYLEHLDAGGAALPEVPDWRIPNDVPNQGPPDGDLVGP